MSSLIMYNDGRKNNVISVANNNQYAIASAIEVTYGLEPPIP